MTAYSPSGQERVLGSAIENFSEDDVRWVLRYPVGYVADFPREGCLAVAGFSKENRLPMVVLIDMNKRWVFHSQKYESKYARVFRSGI